MLEYDINFKVPDDDVITIPCQKEQVIMVFNIYLSFYHQPRGTKLMVYPVTRRTGVKCWKM